MSFSIQRNGPDPTALVDQWGLIGLTPNLRLRIKAALLVADSKYWKWDIRIYKTQALEDGFTAVAEILFKASLLTPIVIQNDLPHFMKETATIARWNELPPIADPLIFFRSQISGCLARLLVAQPGPLVIEGVAEAVVSDDAHLKAERREIFKSYLARFPEKIKILDICWAVKQTRREWKRWMKGESKDGSTPDKSFRSILLGRGRPSEFRKEPRPPEWK